MTPTEHDLRAALHNGEGDGLDVDRIVAGGRARRAQRRTQLLSTAAVVIVVAGAGVGGAALLNRDDNNTSGSGDAALRPQSTAKSAAAGQPAPNDALPSPASSSHGANRDSNSSKAAAVSCPTSFPKSLLPGGGSPGQFGADGPLFADPVDSIVVCSYGSPVQTGTSTPARLVLTDSNATELATSLENAAKVRPSGACPTIRYAKPISLAVIGVTAGGTAMKPVTTTLTKPACNTVVTNGTAVRYNWTPPKQLEPIIRSLTPQTVGTASVPNNTPSGKNIGSPVR